MRLLGKSDIESALPMVDAIRLMGQAFTTITAGSVQSMERQALKTSSGHALLMGASGPGFGIAAKLVTVIPANADKGLPVSSGLALLLDEENGQALALLDATALTTWRTAALVGFATDLLARENARVGVLIGCGTQARTQVLAMAATRELTEIRIFSRDMKRVDAFIDSMQSEVSTPLLAARDRHIAVSDADIISCVTSSYEPVMDGARVQPGCHVNGVGSFRPEMRELDQILIEKATIFVESRETAMAEAGELIAASQAGVTQASDWREIGSVVEGNAPGRVHSEQLTLFKSVGHAVFDLLAARAIYRQAELNQLGTRWSV